MPPQEKPGMPAIGVAIALDRFTTFRDLLRYLRRRAGLTQRELSIAVGYSDTQISRLEQNQRMPDLATLTARFLPVLNLENQPEIAERLVDLAAAIRREDAPAVGLPPYKGLCHFEEADAELFFGREALTGQLLDRVFTRLQTGQRLLGIIGASSSGKSSVVRAGLIPALQWQQPSSGWPVFLMTPTARPLEALASCLEVENLIGLDRRRFVEELGRRPRLLRQSLNKAAEMAGAGHVLLIADQFEELFSLC
jgi:DNA-binding XRE family transcriptional regulator